MPPAPRRGGKKREQEGPLGSEDDAPALRALWAERDPRARRRITEDGRPTVGELREQIRGTGAVRERTGLGLFVVEQRSSAGFAGYCGLVVGQATEAEPELAYELVRRVHGDGGGAGRRGRGGRRGLDAALGDDPRLERAVPRVAEKVGFRESGRVDRDAQRGHSIWYVRDAEAAEVPR